MEILVVLGRVFIVVITYQDQKDLGEERVHFGLVFPGHSPSWRKSGQDL